MGDQACCIFTDSTKYKKIQKNTKKYKSKILAWAYVGSSLLHLHRFNKIPKNTKKYKKIQKNTKARYWHGPMWDQACCIFTDPTKYKKIQKNTKKYKKIQKRDIGMGLCGIKPAASSQIQQNTKKYKKNTKARYWHGPMWDLLHLHRFTKIQKNTKKYKKYKSKILARAYVGSAASSQIQ